MPTKHKTFLSFHHKDEKYRRLFEKEFKNIYISKSVQLDDIDENLKTETIRQKIRDEKLRDSTVTIVLVGKNTWKRKHVDWEISSSIRKTKFNPRSGLLGLLLPTYRPSKDPYDPYTIPPRLHDNVKRGYAKIYPWTDSPTKISRWIDKAFERKDKNPPPVNSYPHFKRNRQGNRWWY